MPERTNPGKGITTPSSEAFNAAATGNACSLNITLMKACGYVAEVVVRERTIVASQGQGWVNSASAGFCLEDSAEEGPALSP